MFVLQVYHLTVDEHIPNFGLDAQRITSGHDDIGNLPVLDRAESIVNAQDFGGVDRDCPQCSLRRLQKYRMVTSSKNDFGHR